MSLAMETVIFYTSTSKVWKRERKKMTSQGHQNLSEKGQIKKERGNKQKKKDFVVF